jgi:serine/threonine protein kinase
VTPVDQSNVLAGRYRIDGPLGAGGMATVYAGTDVRLGRSVAVKVLRPELSDPVSRRRFEMEARLSARLNHANIVSVYDAGEAGPYAFMVMERLPGRTLADEMAAGPMTSARAEEVARQVLAALAAAHAAGVVHRDIKPSNLLLGSDGAVKVADFGIATSLDSALDLTRAGELVGTVSYVAPERITGARATAASDLYSVGAVLYEAVSGRRMFAGAGPLDYARQVVDTDPVPLSMAAPGTDPALAATVDRALQKDPGRRFSSAADMLAALGGPAEAPTATAGWGPPIGVIAPTDVLPREPAVRRRPDRRSPAWWVAGAIALAIAVVVIIALASSRGPAGVPSPSTTVAPVTSTRVTSTTVTSTTVTSTTSPPASPTTGTPTPGGPAPTAPTGGPGHGSGGPGHGHH